MPQTPHIVQVGAPVLRETAEPVSFESINSAELAKNIADMKAALKTQEDGVALAAPQIGIQKRIFVVADFLFLPEDASAEEKEERAKRHTVFINPEIVKYSRKKEWMEEGCLSVRYKYGQVKRASKVRVRAYDETGVPFEYGASNLLAQIFQHEIDHLDGILFIDKAKNVEELDPPPAHIGK